MRHFPIYIDMDGKLVAVSGAGPVAVPKLRLLMKTSAKIRVFGPDADENVRKWAAAGRLELHERELEVADLAGATLLYCANDDEIHDSRAAKLGSRAGALVNIVDNLESSEFITPAIVDRDPVTVAIGTEGSAPVLARMIKSDLETRLPIELGVLARAGQHFRAEASALSPGRERREFWSRFFSAAGPKALASGGRAAVRNCLRSLLREMKTRPKESGKAAFIGVGPGDPDLMTAKARRLLDSADIVIHDSSVPGEILELARREAEFVEIENAHLGFRIAGIENGRLIADRVRNGDLVARLVLGDPDEHANLRVEAETVAGAGLDWEKARGIPSAWHERIESKVRVDGLFLPKAGAFPAEQFEDIAALARDGERDRAGFDLASAASRSFGRRVPAAPAQYLGKSRPGSNGAGAWRQASESAA